MRFVIWLIAALSLVGGAALLVDYFRDPTGGLPMRGDLVPAEGEVIWVDKYRYGIRFGFNDDERKFNYPSKARELGLVRQSLESASGEITTVLIDPARSSSPLYSENIYFTVFEIRVGGHVVRSYSQISEKWMNDQSLMPYLGSFGILGGLWIFWSTRKLPKRVADTNDVV